MNLILFFLFLNFLLTNQQQYESNDQLCISNLISKIGAAHNFSLYGSSTTLYDFCKQTEIGVYDKISCLKSLDYYRVHEISLLQESNEIITQSDINCINKDYLKTLIMRKWILDENLNSFFPTLNLLSLHILECDNLNLNGKYGTQQLYIQLSSNIEEQVLLSNMLNENTTILEIRTNNSNYNLYINNDYQDTEKIISGFYAPVRNLFSMKGVYSKNQISLVLGSNFDYNSINNLTTFGNVGYLQLLGYDRSYPMIPKSILLKIPKTSNQYSLTYINIGFPIDKPDDFLQFNETPVFSHFLLSNVGPQFNIKGLFPYKSLPSSLITFEYSNGKIISLPDISNLFKNTSTKYLIFKNNSISSTLSTWNGKSNNIITLDLSNNELTGTIDPSYCSIILNVKNNKMSGSIPECYACNLLDPLFKNNFLGNNFDNIDNITTICKIVPSLKMVYDEVLFNKITIKVPRLVLYGKNIGYNQNLIEFTPNIHSFDIIKANSLFSTSQYQPNRTIHKLNFTLTNQIFWATPDPYPPQIYNIITDSLSLSIEGSYFTYDDSIVTILVGDVTCIVRETTFYTIKCDLSKTPSSTSNVSSILRVGELETKFFVNITVGEKTSSFTQCDSTVCSFPLGQCNYNFDNVGVCDCTSDWTGSICTIPNHYLSSVLPTNEKGGLVEMNGWFGPIHQNISVYIGNNECVGILITNTSLNCTIVGGKGSHNITIKQNGITWMGLNSFTYIAIEQPCFNNCTDESHGVCDESSGVCKCNSNWSGLDCSSPKNQPNDNSPKTNSTINPDGSTTVVNENTSYNIYITSLLELDLNGNQVKIYPLENNWLINETIDSDYNSTVSFSQTLNNTRCKIELLVQEIKKESNYSFAGIDFNLNAGSVKVSVSINSYEYDGPLNTLQLQMISNVSSNSKDCNSKSAESTTSLFDDQLLNYITISRDNRVLYGRFINRALSDNKASLISTSLISNQNESITIGINIPHFTNKIQIDPDFSVVLDHDFKSECGSSKKSYVIPVAVVVSVVGVAIIVGLTYSFYKKRIELESLKKIIKLNKMNT